MLRKRAAATMGLLALLLVAGGCQQPSANTLDRLLIGEVMMHSELADNLRAICLPGGRLSGSPNGHRAEQLVADKLREYGLRNVHLEPFEMTSWYDRETTVTVLDDPPRVLEGATALANTLSTPTEGVSAELVDLGKGSEEDYAAHDGDVTGKFLLTRGRNPRARDKMSLALQHGAAGLVILGPPDREPIVGNCHVEPRPEPAVVVRNGDGKALAERLGDGETLRLNIKIDAESWLCRPNNVVAEIPGSGALAKEVVIVCAHLDSWHLAEGAIDNGNGATAVLETARALAGVNWRPERTVRFIWFMGEEHGLHGSKAYVRDHDDELDDIVAVINLDMPGSPRTLSCFGHPELMEFLESVGQELAGYEITMKNSAAKGSFSDHAPFMRQGVATMCLWGELGPGVKHYHSTKDTYDQVDRRATVQSAAVVVVLVRRLADCPQRPSERLAPPEPESKPAE